MVSKGTCCWDTDIYVPKAVLIRFSIDAPWGSKTQTVSCWYVDIAFVFFALPISPVTVVFPCSLCKPR